MSSEKPPVTVKKYANRRLYNTASSAYVTLEDLASMVKSGSDFVVTDAKNGEDITRSVLAQIIFEQEGKHGQSLLPITFLRQLIRFYGSGMQMLVPSFLEMSLANFAKDGGVFGQLLGSKALANAGFQGGGVFAGKAFPHDPLSAAARPVLEQIEEQTRRNVALFQQAMTMFAPFPTAETAAGGRGPEPHGSAPHDAPSRDVAEAGAWPGAAGPPAGAGTEPTRSDEVDAMRRQLEEMQRRLEMLAGREG